MTKVNGGKGSTVLTNLADHAYIIAEWVLPSGKSMISMFLTIASEHGDESCGHLFNAVPSFAFTVGFRMSTSHEGNTAQTAFERVIEWNRSGTHSIFE